MTTSDDERARQSLAELSKTTTKRTKRDISYTGQVIYLLECPTTGDKYIGSTSQRLASRLSVHRRNVNGSKNKLYIRMAEVGPENFIIRHIKVFNGTTKDQLNTEIYDTAIEYKCNLND